VIENVPLRTSYGHSQISQLVALCMLDAEDLLLVSKAWAADRRVVSNGRVVAKRKTHIDTPPAPRPRAIKMLVETVIDWAPWRTRRHDCQWREDKETRLCSYSVFET
jgi:hypothetical protein